MRAHAESCSALLESLLLFAVTNELLLFNLRSFFPIVVSPPTETRIHEILPNDLALAAKLEPLL